jgi:hypothetical protein
MNKSGYGAEYDFRRYRWKPFVIIPHHAVAFDIYGRRG